MLDAIIIGDENKAVRLGLKKERDVKWHICRTDFSDVCYVMTGKPFDEKADAEKCLEDFLNNQTKLHHQDYEVTDEVPDGANWDNPVLNLK